jgi:amidase
MDIALRSTAALADAIRTREIGCLELLDHYLARVERLNPKLNAIVILDADAARKRAKEAVQAIAKGVTWGPLHGVPYTIKDSFETAALRTTCGWQVTKDHVPSTDAIAVERLRNAGAVIFGKTNVPTLASDVQSYNPIFGVTNNPWDVARTPGGSSGGAAAAISAGLTGGDIGSDIGGSIRTPSGWCGIFGHKTTFGIIPGRGHIPGPPGALADPDLGVFGPMGRSADDLDLGLDVMVGASPEMARAWTIALPPPRRNDLKAYRMAVWLDDPAAKLDGEVRRVLAAAVDALRRAGVSVVDRRPDLDLGALVQDYFKMLYPIVLAGMPDEGFENMARMAATLPKDDDSPLARSARAIAIRYRDWIHLNEHRHKIRAKLDDFFRDVDVLLTPIVPVPAISHDHSEPFPARTIVVDGEPAQYTELFAWIAPATYAHLPATAAPVGRTKDGLPVGVQIVGPYLEDRTTIDVARRLTQVVGGYETPGGFA